MDSSTHLFKHNTRVALHDETLQRALAKARGGFVDKRAAAVNALPEFEKLQADARAIKEHSLEYLDVYLEHYEQQVEQRGGHVHWARTPEDACKAIVNICLGTNARRIAKGKSMVGEEIAVNDALQAAGFEVIETDLGEYIIQLAREAPSHIIAPAVHKTKEQITDLFHTHHAALGYAERQTEIPAIVNEARQVLRDQFLTADVGITGANFLIAETGSNIIVTNEGNGDLSCSIPRVHIVIAAIDKLVPTLNDASTLLRLLARSATGQEITSYTTFSTGPRRDGDLDGPEEYHVVLLDNGRSDMLGNEFRDMLHCIRCGACLNHCPVYSAVGGHAYGWVYPGPMGAVLTPLMLGVKTSGDLPNACTLNGRCQQVCPMGIPLPEMLRGLRRQQFETGLGPRHERWALRLWAWFAKHPRLYRFLADIKIRVLAGMSCGKGYFRAMPFARGWTESRDLPAPQGETFVSAWRRRNGEQR